jgi:type VI secretion system protein ImpL
VKKLLQVLGNKWVLRFLGLIALALLIWFVGPLIAIAGFEPLGNLWVRIALIAILFLALLAALLWSRLKADKSERQMMESLSEAGDQSSVDLSAEEIEILQQRLGEALETLKKSRKDRHDYTKRYLYELPWYVVIGPPGCGKTTLLINSDLEFPLAEQFGKDAVAGVGGTRNCDWWFTNDAILLDTAGRYTTQDSHGEADAGTWLGFLDLLKKHRPRRPINGAIVAISLSDLMLQTEQERHLHAMAVRSRIQELHERLGVRFPIYLMLTKSDLVAGFNEFFERLGREERAQVWGSTFLLADAGLDKDMVSRFEEEYDALMERIYARLLFNLQNERDPGRRALMYGFPQQMESLKEPLARFLREAFKPNRFQEPPLLRGVYLTSGTQEGTPIDRLMGTLAQSFGLDRTTLPSFSGIGRSYFINNLFRRVIFPEANLVGTDPGVERRRRWIRRGAFASIFLATIALVLGWVTSFTGNQTAIAHVEQAVDAFERTAAEVPPGSTDFERVVVPLDHLREVADVYPDDTPLRLGLGLYQGDKLDPAAQSAYRKVLQTRFLYSIGARVEDILQQETNDRPLLAEALKVYLMLGNPDRLDAKTVTLFMTADWALHYPGKPDLQERLTQHLETLLQKRFQRLQLHAGLVQQTRRILAEVPVEQDIYTKVKVRGEARPELRLTLVDLLGRDGNRIFASAQGQLDATAIPGLYTTKGYQAVYAPESKRLIDARIEDQWVYDGTAKGGVPNRTELTSRVEELYVNDYIEQWRQMLNTLNVVQPRGLPDAVEVLDLASGPASPLRRLLNKVAEETRLAEAAQNMLAQVSGVDSALAEKAAGAASAALEAASALSDSARYQRNRAELLLSAAGQAGIGTPGAADPFAGLKRVDEAFRPVRELVSADGEEKSELEFLLADLAELHGLLLNMDESYNPARGAYDLIGEGKDPAQKLRRHAQRLPNPVRGWMYALSERGKATVVDLAKGELASLWENDVLPFCRRAIDGRYPFMRNARRATTLGDFSRFFGPGQKFDKFFQSNVERFVDTSVSPWRWRTVGRESIGMSDDSLVQFERAARIRDAFFPTGGALPSVPFTARAIALDSGSLKFLLDLDGQQMVYRHGPEQTVNFTWPAPGGVGKARAVFEDISGESLTLSEEGDWGWFRLLDRARLRVGDSPDRITATFSRGGHSASVEIRADSVINPFLLPELEKFRCPATL